jgi:hypothetical protein
MTESGYYSPGGSAAAGTLGGAAVGAALGSIIGAAAGSPATGAWVGAAAGGVLGGVGSYLYAQHKNNEIRSQAMAAQAYSYTPTMGTVVAIDRADVIPGRVRAGQQVNMVLDYTILTPYNTPVDVTLRRDLSYAGNPIGQSNTSRATNVNGSYQDQVALTIPGNAAPGTYTVTSRVITSVGSAERNTYFVVD